MITSAAQVRLSRQLGLDPTTGVSPAVALPTSPKVLSQFIFWATSEPRTISCLPQLAVMVPASKSPDVYGVDPLVQVLMMPLLPKESVSARYVPASWVTKL